MLEYAWEHIWDHVWHHILVPLFGLLFYKWMGGSGGGIRSKDVDMEVGCAQRMQQEDAEEDVMDEWIDGWIDVERCVPMMKREDEHRGGNLFFCLYNVCLYCLSVNTKCTHSIFDVVPSFQGCDGWVWWINGFGKMFVFLFRYCVFALFICHY